MHWPTSSGSGGGGRSRTRARGLTYRWDVGSDEDANDDNDDFDRVEPSLFSMPSHSNPSMPGSSHQFCSSSHEVGASSSSQFIPYSSFAQQFMTTLSQDIDLRFSVSFEELFNSQMPPRYAQFHVQDTNIYRSY